LLTHSNLVAIYQQFISNLQLLAYLLVRKHILGLAPILYTH
jgi:hypothetical protein